MHTLSESEPQKRIAPRILRRVLFGLGLGLGTIISQANSTFPPLDPSGGGKMIEGKIIWVDMFTADVKAATKFYTSTFGWTAEELTLKKVTYILLRSNGTPVAGLIYRKRVRGEDASGLWVGYISVDSISRAVAAAKRGGGRTLIEPGVLSGRGAHAIIADSEGSITGLLHSTSGDPADTQPDIGEWAWSTLLSRDAAQAAKNCLSIYDYDETRSLDTKDGDQIFLMADGYARADIATLPEGDETHPGWVHFIRVKNLGEAIDMAIQNGANTLLEPTQSVFDGHLAVIEDPVGAAVGLIEWTRETKEEEQ